MEISITNKTDKPIEFPAGTIVGLKYSHTPYVKDILAILEEPLQSGEKPKEVVFMKGAAIGMSSGIIPGAISYYITPEIKEL